MSSPWPDLPEALQPANAVLLRCGKDPQETAWDLLRGVGQGADGPSPVAALKKTAGLDGDAWERLLLWHAARAALPQLVNLPVDSAVRENLANELPQLYRIKDSVEVGSYRFDRAAKIATLRRFPAGPMEWETSGIPRSFFLKAGLRGALRLLGFVAFRLGGRAPCFFMHVAPPPRNRGLSVPSLVRKAYYCMARSMELQPGIRALLAHAWFHDPAAVQDYPHLEALNEPYRKHGGLITVLGPADEGSGVLEGNRQRRAEYLAGKVQYRYGLAVWPRAAAIRWARAYADHPDWSCRTHPGPL